MKKAVSKTSRNNISIGDVDGYLAGLRPARPGWQDPPGLLGLEIVLQPPEKMKPEDAIQLVEQFIAAYNGFDVEGMIALLHPDCSFRNLSGGQVNASTDGIEEFQKLAEMSASLFASRRQTITGSRWSGDTLIVEIDFEGTLTADIPGGPKAGEILALHGRSEYHFRDGKIASIADYS